MFFCNGSYKKGKGLKIHHKSGCYRKLSDLHRKAFKLVALNFKDINHVRLGDKGIRIKGQPRVQEIGIKKRGKKEQGEQNPKKEKTRHPRREYTKRQVTRIGKTSAVQEEMATKSTNTMEKNTIKTYGKGGKNR